MSEKKKVRYVRVDGYIDIYFTISKVFNKQIAKPGDVFMIISKEYYKGEGVKNRKEQIALPIPAKCTPEQQSVLFEKYLELTKGKGNDKSISPG